MIADYKCNILSNDLDLNSVDAIGRVKYTGTNGETTRAMAEKEIYITKGQLHNATEHKSVNRVFT